MDVKFHRPRIAREGCDALHRSASCVRDGAKQNSDHPPDRGRVVGGRGRTEKALTHLMALPFEYCGICFLSDATRESALLHLSHSSATRRKTHGSTVLPPQTGCRNRIAIPRQSENLRLNCRKSLTNETRQGTNQSLNRKPVAGCPLVIPGRRQRRGEGYTATHQRGPPRPLAPPMRFIIFIRPPPFIFFIMSRICSN